VNATSKVKSRAKTIFALQLYTASEFLEKILDCGLFGIVPDLSNICNCWGFWNGSEAMTQSQRTDHEPGMGYTDRSKFGIFAAQIEK